MSLPPMFCVSRAIGVWLLMSLGLLAGCSFPGAQAPAALYSLRSMQTPPSGAPATCSTTLAFRELELAAWLDRPEVVLKRDGPLVVASPLHLWAAPLRTELAQLFSASLQDQGAQVFPYPLRQGQLPSALLTIALDGLHATSNQAHIELRWQAWTPGSVLKPATPLGASRLKLSRPLGGTTPGAIVEAYSALVHTASIQLWEQFATHPSNARLCGRETKP